MVWRVLGGVGRTMMTAGVLILAFVVYQLWGTGLQEARSQDKLTKQFEEQKARLARTSPSTTSTTTTTTTAAPGPAPSTTDPNHVDTEPVRPLTGVPVPENGEPIGMIRIPKIAITRTVVQGITADQLKRGPGHYPTTPLPGERGTVAIAGHRTTYGQPFHNVDKLDPGDQIQLETLRGRFVYEITGTKIVKPRQTEVLDEQKGPDGQARPLLVLTACHPKYSARQRIIVEAKLVGTPVPPLQGERASQRQAAEEAGRSQEETATIDGGLSGESQPRTPAIVWGLICAAIWLAAWLVQVGLRRRSGATALGRWPANTARRTRLLTWTPYAVALPVFVVALYCFFENFGRLLPGNY